MITRKSIEDRIAELKKGQAEAIANVNAFNGAIQDCEHWLEQIEAPEPKAPAKEPVLKAVK